MVLFCNGAALHFAFCILHCYFALHFAFCILHCILHFAVFSILGVLLLVCESAAFASPTLRTHSNMVGTKTRVDLRPRRPFTFNSFAMSAF